MKLLLTFFICFSGFILSYATDNETNPPSNKVSVTTGSTSEVKIANDTHEGNYSLNISTITTEFVPTTSKFVPTDFTTAQVITITPENYNHYGTWNVTENNVTCIKIEGEIKFDYSYKNRTTNTSEIATIYVLPKANVTGSCHEKTTGAQKIKFSWDIYNVTFVFVANKDNFTLKEVNLEKSNSTKDKQIRPVANDHLGALVTPLNNSYSCAAESTFNITSNPLVTLSFGKYQIQAFKTSTGKDFDAAIDCSGHTTPDIVPIIVGCVLALLIIAILIAYLISRRRSQARGYLSM